MKVLHRKLLRDLRLTRGMLLAIISIMAVGVLCFVAMRALYFDLKIAQQEYYDQCRMADFWVDLKKVPVAEIARLTEISGVGEIRPRIGSLATVDLPDSRLPLNGLVLSLPDKRQPVINDILIRSGGYFTGERPNEVIVNEAFAKVHELQPGDQIHLLINNRRQELLIVGTAISCEFIYLVSPGEITPTPERFGVFYLPHDFAEEIYDMQGAANQAVGRLSPETSVPVEEILQQVERRLAPFGVLATTKRKDQVSHTFISSEIEGLKVFSTLLPTIFLSVAALVLNILLSRLTEQQRTIIGTLKALGYENRTIFAHYVEFGLILGCGGALAGCGLGYLMANGLTLVYLEFFQFPTLETHLYPEIYLTGALVSVACALAGSIHGAWAAVRLQPAEAMRPKPPVAGRRIWLERIDIVWSNLSFSWRMVARNLLRNRLRSLVGLFAASMGSCLLVVSFISVDAFTFLIDFQFQKIDRSDLELSFDDEQGRAALLESARLPGIDYAEPVLNVACRFYNGNHQRKGSVTGLVREARLTIPRDLEGRPMRIPARGLLMTPKIAELLHVSVGDKLTMQPTQGLQRPVEVPVVEISESYLGSTVYADLHYLSELVGEEFALSGVQLQMNPRPEERAKLYEQLKELPALQGVKVRVETIENLQETLVKSQWISIFTLVLFSGILFFGSVLNASLVSLAEREREIATLRVVGYTEWEIGWLLCRESVFINTLGTLLGLPLGYQLYLLVAEMNSQDFMQLPVIAPLWVWIVTLALSFLFAAAAQVIVQRKIHRMDWRAALRVRE